MELQVEKILTINNKGRIGIIFETKDKNLIELIFTERLLHEFISNIDDIQSEFPQFLFLVPASIVIEPVVFNGSRKPIRYNVDSIGPRSYSKGDNTISFFLIVEECGEIKLTIPPDSLKSLYQLLMNDGDIAPRISAWADFSVKNIGGNPEEAEVYIYLPNHVELIVQEKIVNACGEFMEALGFVIKTEDEPILNSFWKRLQFVFKRNITQDDADRLFNKGKQALELKLIDAYIADQTDKLASATEKLLNSIEKYENATIRLGTLLIIKRSGHTLVHQLTSDEVFLLNKFPSIFKQNDPLESIHKILEQGIQHMNPELDDNKVINAPSSFKSDEH